MILKVSHLIAITKFLLLILPITIAIPLGFQIGGILFTWIEATLISLFIVITSIYLIQGRINELLIIDIGIIPIVLFCSVMFISLLFSTITSDGIMIIIRFIESIVLIILVLKGLKITNIPIDSIFNALKYSGFLGAIYAVSQFYFGIGSISDSKNITRVFGLLHGGAFGIIPAIGFVLSIISILKEKSLIKKNINLIICLVCFLGLFLTLTRTWLLAAFFGIAIYIGSRSLLKLIISSLVVLLLSLISLNYFINSEFLNTLYGRGAKQIYVRYSEIFYGESSSINMRFEKWESAIDIMLKHPFLGVGLENLNLNVKRASSFGQKRSDNQFLDILAMGGLISFLLFSYMMLWMLLTGFKLCNKPNPIGTNGRKFIAVYITWFIGSIFWSILYGFSGLMFALVVTIGMYLNNLDKNQNEYSI